MDGHIFWILYGSFQAMKKWWENRWSGGRGGWSGVVVPQFLLRATWINSANGFYNEGEGNKRSYHIVLIWGSIRKNTHVLAGITLIHSLYYTFTNRITSLLPAFSVHPPSGGMPLNTFLDVLVYITDTNIFPSLPFPWIPFWMSSFIILTLIYIR